MQEARSSDFRDAAMPRIILSLTKPPRFALR